MPRKEAKERLYYVRDKKAREILDFGAKTQIFVAGEKGIKGPYTTANGVVDKGYRRLKGIEPLMTLPEIAQEFGCESMDELHPHLKAVVCLIQGSVDDAKFYMDESNASQAQRENIWLMASSLKQIRG